MKAFAKTFMVVAEDRFRSATAVGGAPRLSDWQVSFDEQVPPTVFPSCHQFLINLIEHFCVVWSLHSPR